MRESRGAAQSHYLDTATYGLPSDATIAVLEQALHGWQTGSARWVDAWDASGESARATFAQIVADRLAQPDAQQGFLLDGYPRTLDQIFRLDEMLAAAEADLQPAPLSEAGERIGQRHA